MGATEGVLAWITVACWLPSLTMAPMLISAFQELIHPCLRSYICVGPPKHTKWVSHGEFSLHGLMGVPKEHSWGRLASVPQCYPHGTRVLWNSSEELVQGMVVNSGDDTWGTVVGNTHLDDLSVRHSTREQSIHSPHLTTEHTFATYNMVNINIQSRSLGQLLKAYKILKMISGQYKHSRGM